MGMLKLDIPHTFHVEHAKARVTVLLEGWARSPEVNITWTGDRASFNGKVMGVSFHGTLTVLPQKIAIEATDPGILWRGQAQRYLTGKFNDCLDPKKSLNGALDMR